MSTYELLELASLDAMGLLDPEERESFELAFRAAPPALQAQIRREQLRLSDLDGMLPAIDPPPGLRARVMAKVREAIGSMTIHRISGGAIVPDLRPAFGVNRLWRVGAIAAAAASVVLGLSVIQMRIDYQDVQHGVGDNFAHDTILKDFGIKFSQSMFDPQTRFVQFSQPAAVSEDAQPFAGRALLVVEGTGSGELFLKDLTAGSEYEVVVIDADGREVIADLTIRSSGAAIERRQFDDVVMGSTREVGIRLRGSSKLLLRTAGI